MLGATIKRVGAMIEIIGVMIEREHHINKEKVIIMKEMEMINTTIINIQMAASWADVVKEIIRRRETIMIELFIIYGFLIKYYINQYINQF